MSATKIQSEQPAPVKRSILASIAGRCGVGQHTSRATERDRDPAYREVLEAIHRPAR
jgi:hypothetical protein